MSEVSTARLETGVGLMRCELSGAQGAPLMVLVHGLPGSARDFRHLAPKLARFARVALLNLPGFGDSDAPPAGGASLARRAAWVSEAIEALEPGEPVTLLGHSMGGAVAAAVAATRPELVARLALLATPGMRPHYPTAMMRAAALVLRVPGLDRALQPGVRAGFVRFGFPPTWSDEALTQAVMDAAATRWEDHRAHVRALRAPTLVAYAEDDRLIGLAIARTLAQAAPAGPRLVFATGGHNIQKAQAEALEAALEGFVLGAERAR